MPLRFVVHCDTEIKKSPTSAGEIFIRVIIHAQFCRSAGNGSKRERWYEFRLQQP